MRYRFRRRRIRTEERGFRLTTHRQHRNGVTL
jgi:hypothetical protein